MDVGIKRLNTALDIWCCGQMGVVRKEPTCERGDLMGMGGRGLKKRGAGTRWLTGNKLEMGRGPEGSEAAGDGDMVLKAWRPRMLSYN